MDPKLSANLYVVMLDLYNCQPAAATPTYSDTYHLSICIIVRWPASLDVQLRVRDGHVVRYLRLVLISVGVCGSINSASPDVSTPQKSVVSVQIR